MEIVPLLQDLWADPKIIAMDFGAVPKLNRASVVFPNPAPSFWTFLKILI